MSSMVGSNGLGTAGPSPRKRRLGSLTDCASPPRDGAVSLKLPAQHLAIQAGVLAPNPLAQPPPAGASLAA